MGDIVDTLARDYAKPDVAVSLDAIKDLCFRFATQSGLTVSIDDVRHRPRRRDPRRHEKQADKVEQQFRRGIITDGERRQKEVEIWSEATEEVKTGWRTGSKASSSTRST